MASWSLEYSFNVDTKTRVIYAKVFGIWKAETGKNYHTDFKTEVEPLLGKPWAKLIDLTNWKTSFPDVVDVIGEHMEWSREHQCILSLYVLNNPSTFRQLNQMFDAGGTKEISLIFRTVAEAEQYLKENWTGKLKKGA